MMYVLIPKSGKGCKWHIKASDLFKGNYVKAKDKSGFETVVDIRNYNVCR